MASTTSESAFSYTKEYEVGAGTINKGQEYEFKMVALVSLRCLLQEFDDIWIASNAARLGAWDDVVVNAQRKHGDNIKILMQLKHGERGSDIERQELLAGKGDYSILKYCDHIDKLKECLDCKPKQTGIIKDLGTSNNMYFVLFTNRGTDKHEFLEDGGCDAISFLNTGENSDNLYRLNLTKVPKLPKLPNLDFSINFYFFAKQSHANHLDELIETEMKKVIRHFKLTNVNIKTVSSLFFKYVADWAMGKLGSHYYLTKQGILYKLSELLLCQYELDFSREKLDFYDCPQKLLWNEVVKDKAITVVDSDDEVVKFMKLYIGTEIKPYYQNSGIFWSDKFSNKKQGLFYRQHPDLEKAMLKIVGNFGKITSLSIYRCLWLNERLPLLLKMNALEDYQIILKILNLPNCKLKVIILNTTKLMPTITDGTSGYFGSISDLNNDSRLKILNNSAKLQGRSRVVLKELVDDSLFQHISCNAIIDILSGNFNIGFEYEPLSECFVKRSLLKIFLKVDVLEEIQDEAFVIEVNEETEDESVREKLDMLISKYKTKTKIIFDGNIPQQIEELKLRRKPIHRLVFHGENLLEWKESFGSTSRIREYQSSNQKASNQKEVYGSDKFYPSYFLDEFDEYVEETESLPKNEKWLCNELEDILSTNIPKNFFNGVNLVSASPGMGKSTLLDYVAWTAPTEMWVLNVKLIDHEDYFDDAESRSEILTARDHLKYFNEWILEQRNSSNNRLARDVFEKFVSANQVLVMLDGFDEVPLSCKHEVKEIANCLHKAGFPIWLTTRPHLMTELEEKFVTISSSLRPFSVDDQKTFLNRYFKQIGDKVNDNTENHQTLIEEFVQELLRASRDSLNDTDGEFTGIPLQTQLLANAFSEQLKHSLSTGTIQFERRFDLLHLYKEFMKRKDNILRDKFGRGAKNMKILFHKHQQLFALKLVFSDYNLHRLDITGQLNDYYKNNEDQIQFLQQDGITVIQRNLSGTGLKFQVSFVHRTFAEYMAAFWLLNNFNSERDDYRWAARFFLQKRGMFIEYYGLLFRMFDSMLAKDCRLHVLVINGRLDEAQKLVKSNPNLMDEIDGGGRSFLHIVAIYGVNPDSSFDHISYLYDRMTDYKIINMTDNFGYTPLALLHHSLPMEWELYQKSEEITIGTNMLLIYTIFIKTKIDLKYETSIGRYLPLIIYQALLTDSNSINYDTTIASYCNKLFKNYRNFVAIVNAYTNELEITTISELLTSVGIKSAAEPPYYYDLRFAAKFGTSLNVLDLISSECTTVNQENFNNYYTPLYWAVKYNRLEIVKILLYYGESVNEPCIQGVTPLHSAAENGYTDIVRELLSNQAEVNIQNDDGDTSLILALKNKHANAAKLLLSNNATVSVKNMLDCFPVYYAAKNGLDDIIPELLKGVNVNRPNLYDETPLDVAISNRHLSTVQLLLLNGADCNIPNSNNELPLHTTAAEGLPEILAEILSKTVGNAGNTSSIYFATYNSTSVKYEAVDIINIKGRTPLHLSIFNVYTDTIESLDVLGHRSSDRLKIVKFLLNKGAHTDIRDNLGNTVLHYLCCRCPLVEDDRNRAVKLLLDHGADVNFKNKNGRTPLLEFFCSSEDNSTHFFEIFSRLCSKDNVSIQDIDGNTVLHYICRKCQLNKDDRKQVVTLLLNQGADVNLKNNDGRTPLLEFLSHLSENIPTHLFDIFSLLNNPGKVNIQDTNRNTVLHYLCRKCQLDRDDEKGIVTLLLDQGADVNLKNINGRTPLHEFFGHISLTLSMHISSEGSSTYLSDIFALLASNDNVNIQDKNGNTVLHYICGNCQLDKDDEKRVVTLFLKQGADVNLQNNKRRTSLLEFLSRLFLEGNSTNLLEICSLLSSEDNVNIQDIDGNTVLHYFCRNCQLNKDDGKSVVTLLLKEGADVNLKNINSRTPIHEFVSYLFSEDTSTNLLEIFSLLSSEDNVNIQDIDGNTVLHYFCRNCQLNKDDGKSVVTLLLEEGADVNLKNINSRTPIHEILSDLFLEGHSTNLFEIFSLLSSEDNVNIQDIDGNTVLHYLCRKCQFEKDYGKRAFKSLLVKGADVNLKNNDGLIPLHLFLNNLPSKYNFRHFFEIVSLLSNQDNVNMQDINGDTVLHCLSWTYLSYKDYGKRAVKLLLDKGADVNKKNNDGQTALLQFLNRLSLEDNSTNLFETFSLLSSENNVNIQDVDGSTALHYLCQECPLDKDNGKRAIKSLLDKGADVNLKNNDGLIPLHFFLNNLPSKYSSGHFFDIVSLLSSEDNVNIQDINGDTVLHYLSWPYLLDTDYGKRAVKSLLVKGADVNLNNTEGDTPLLNYLLCLEYNSTQLFEIVSLLSSETNVNNRNINGDTALHYLCQECPLDKDNGKRAIKSLLDKGADVNLKNDNSLTPLLVFLLHLSSEYNSGHHFQIVSLLSSADNVNSQNINGDTALHYLCRTCPLDKDDPKTTITLLLDRGADVNLKNNNCLTPLLVFLLHLSSEYNSAYHFQIVSLLSSEDNVNSQNINGDTALHYLCRRCPLDKDDPKTTVTLLLDRGADVNIQNKNGLTPLLVFLSRLPLKYNSTHFCEMFSLLSSETNVNVQDIHGYTALHYLCKKCALDNNDRETAAISLLNKGIDVNLTNQYGKSALDVAVHFNTRVMTSLLERIETNA